MSRDIGDVDQVADWITYDPKMSKEEMKKLEGEFRKKYEFFGTDVAKIPCFRDSYLYGLISGFGMGISSFAFTSNTRRSINFGFYSYATVTFVYWCYCRWNRAVTKFQYDQLKSAIRERREKEGTEADTYTERAKVLYPRLNIKDEPMPMGLDPEQ